MSDKTYIFTIELQGTGSSPDDAWRDATDAFALDPGDYDKFEVED